MLLPLAIILAIGALSPSVACAESLVVSIASKHVVVVHKAPPEGYHWAPYNEVNPGIGYISDNGYTIGTYYNSYFKQTYYMGYTSKCYFMDCSILVASGYEAIGKVLNMPKVLQSTLPMVVISYDALTYGRGSITINYVVQSTAVQVFGLSLKVDI